ncbi:hypothetical protein Vadar_033405 [Vaccinium darrowii]|uniref:Uncharacterized protein n=1 Tax=Vaccinium darrowii TaxID=229202 RepID=A0ACB7ZP88_9ERIC|nr:hypothetical protein Vadar_033405 [Vaccinium darrowii]
MGDVIDVIPTKVDGVMNQRLTSNITGTEVQDALMSMHPTKSPGVDGMTALFFQTYWHILGSDITKAIQGFFHGGYLLRSLNQTLISLIPKINCPTKPSQFRPISLCNVLYKLITKILANRLRLILPSIISENQSAFIGGRQISDNILVAHEVMHTLKNRRYGRKGWFALKLDMAKAYDRLEWGFIEGVLRKFGFNPQNQWQFEGQQWEPTTVFEKAKVAWKEYSAVCELTMPKGRPSSISLPSVWQPPPLGCLKINVDGALDSQNGFGSVGLIARTSSGAIVEA